VLALAAAGVVAGVRLLGRGDVTREAPASEGARPAAAESPPPRPAPPPAPAAPAPAAPAASAAPPDAAANGDDRLIEDIRANVRRDPRRAEALARQARSRFPGSPNADERDALLVDALINQQRIGAARSETYYYYDHHPNGKFAAHLFSMTGVHPAPPTPGPH